MSDARTFAVTGASGLVGSQLVKELEEDGVRVLRLVRRPVENEQEIRWNPAEGIIDAARLEGVDTVIHLAGKGIATGRWTGEFKRQIVESRTKSTRLLSETLAQLEHKPRVLVGASAIGFYGDRGAEPVDEDSPLGIGFLPEMCQQWEAAYEPASEAGIRTVQVRIGVVLSPNGGAIEKMLPTFKWGVGGRLGNGRQMMSWVALHDLIRVLRFAADSDSLHSAVNATAPHPVTNREFTRTLGKVLGRPTLLPAPAFALRLLLGEMADALLLEGASILPKRLEEAGFAFETPRLAEALERVLAET